MLFKLLDLGSNSFQVQRLRVTEACVETLDKAKVFFRLGTRLSAGGTFSEDTLTEAVLAVERLLLRVPGSGDPWGIATAAVRQAQNGPQLLQRLEQHLGFPLFLLTADEEAELAYRGALTELGPRGAEATLVVDLGGGSTEMAWGDALGSVARLSLPWGTLELGQVEHAPGQSLRQRLMQYGSWHSLARPVRRLVFASGAPRAVAKVGNGLGMLPAASSTFFPAQLQVLAERLHVLSDSQLLAAGCPFERVDSLRPAARLMSALVDITQAPAWRVVSAGVREGTAQVLAQLNQQRSETYALPRGNSRQRLLQRVDRRLHPNWSLLGGEQRHEPMTVTVPASGSTGAQAPPMAVAHAR